jgi:uncharacterized protein (DUF1330 family)
MPKGYIVNTYRRIKDPDKVAAYAKLAAPAIQAHGGRFLVRGPTLHAFELGQKERTVVVEFESVEKALAAHDSPGYQEALRALGDGAERDFRVCEGLAQG